jgi:hypothetical protein
MKKFQQFQKFCCPPAKIKGNRFPKPPSSKGKKKSQKKIGKRVDTKAKSAYISKCARNGGNRKRPKPSFPNLDNFIDGKAES